MRIFVAGATGVIGRSLVPGLVHAGHEVSAMTRTSAGAEPLRSLGAEAFVADAYDRVGVRTAMERARPGAVMHQLTDLGAANSADNARLRVQGTRNLVDAALAVGASRIIAQSIAWAYQPGDGPADEAVELDVDADEPRRATVRAVASLEAAARELPEWVVLRYGLLYGPGTWYAPDGRWGEEARAGRMTGDDDVSSFVHVGDAALAAVQALGWPSGFVNVCDDEPAAGRDWTPAFCRAVGAPPPPVAAGGRAPWARGADNRHARDELGWIPHHPSWRTGFAAQR